MIIFDTETTGLVNPEGATEQPRIIEFGAIAVDEKTLKVQATLGLLLNPWGFGKKGELPQAITRVTGIKSSDLWKEPDFAMALPKVAEFFLGHQTMVAHNLHFDRDLLRYELERLGMVCRFPWPVNHLCTVEMLQPILGKRTNLTEAYDWATGGQQTFKAHRASDDCKACLEVIKKIKSEGCW